MASKPLCSIPDCGKPRHARTYCSAHYCRWKRHGDASIRARPHNGAVGDYLRNTVFRYDGDECLIWPFSTNKGYGQICVGNNKLVGAHRVVCEHVHGKAPSPAHHAAHSCGNGSKGCVTKRHLSWKTPVENQADRLIHGTHGRGERCATAKLSEAEVRKMRSLIGVEQQRDIAAQFGVSISLVSMIKSGKCWGWLT